MLRQLAVITVALLAVREPALTQDVQQQPRALRSGRRPVLPAAEEVALARSAAPSSISANARVLALTDTGYALIAAGSSSVTCVVNRSWDRSVEPHCYDPEGAATVMQIELRRNYLRHIGTAEDEISEELALGLMSGKYRLPSRPALTYMMSAQQVLYDDTGKYAGKWRPHLMIYYPNLSTKAMALPTTPDMRVGMVGGDGGAESSLIIIMSAFADVTPIRP
ncbi:MAG: hypothetical protein WD825_01460 [Gemmatimonadaceae bacterium]